MGQIRSSHLTESVACRPGTIAADGRRARPELARRSSIGEQRVVVERLSEREAACEA
jgi:hypothetical protein